MNAQVQLPIDSAAKIYLMRNDFGLYKIGISINPEDRRAQIENSSGVPTTILDLFDSADAYQEEQALHSVLKDVRRCGEWFALGDDQAARDCVSRGLRLIRGASDDGETLKLAAQYRLSLEAVEHALREAGAEASCCDSKVFLRVQGRLLTGQQALKVATAVVHSSLVNAGYCRPDRNVIAQYIEAISLMRTVVPDSKATPQQEALSRWAAECLCLGPDLVTSSAKLLGSWRRYAAATGQAAGSARWLGAAMRELGFMPWRSSGCRGWRGAALKETSNNTQPQGEAPCSTTTMTNPASACAPGWP